MNFYNLVVNYFIFLLLFMPVPPLIYISATIASIFNFISNHMEWFFKLSLSLMFDLFKREKPEGFFKNSISRS